ncbi:MAG: 30S ribosomal protein S21 [Bacteroidetes bacterium]|nr:30S ribosomal protein S21 [Bacteroidota bacterium]
MLNIPVKNGEPIEKALKRFKKKFERTGVLKAVRARAFFTKPSVKRRNTIIKAQYKQKMYVDENY